MPHSDSTLPCPAPRTPASAARRLLLLAFAAGSVLGSAAMAQQQGAVYPSKPIRIIVPFTAGSLGDQFIRPIAEGMAKSLGQPVLVDNRPGASQAIGAQEAARASPDGHTLFMGTQSGLVLNRIARKSLPFDAERDFTPVTSLFVPTMYLYVRPGLPVNNVQDLIKLARDKPGKLSFASIGPGTSSHLAGEMLKTMNGINLLHVPFKSGPEANTALIGGLVDIEFDGANGMRQMLGRGAHVIGIASRHRAGNLPNIPTLDEQGLKGFDVSPWFGLFAPAGTPRPIIDKLNSTIVPLLKAADTMERGKSLGLEITPGTPEDLGAQIRSDYPVLEKIMRQAGIEPE